MRFKKYNMETKTDKHLSVDPKYDYVGVKLNLMSNCDTLRDCRKSPEMAVLAISHSIKSMTYKHQIHRFRVFRQSLRVSQFCQKCRYAKISQHF